MTAARPTRRLTSAAVLIGLLGACAVLVVLVEAPAGSGTAGRRPGHPVRPRKPSEAALARPPAAAMPAATRTARQGLRLMTEAAAASLSVAFRGVQISDWWGPSGATSASVLQVWHRPDGKILVRPSGSDADPSDGVKADGGQAGDAALTGQDEVMTVTGPLLALMRRNYEIRYAGHAAVDGRPALVVEVSRPDGVLAARFWVDTATKVPLRRELYDTHAKTFSEDAFIGFTPGAVGANSMPTAVAQPWSGQLTSSDRSALAAKGWPLPGSAVGGLSLFQSSRTTTSSGTVVELSYSDGLSVISLFLQHGQLAASMPGWRRITSPGGGTAYATDPDDRSLAWSADGFVYTMISDAPATVIRQAVTHLPHETSPDFWGRMRRGMQRLISWADPFR